MGHKIITATLVALFITLGVIQPAFAYRVFSDNYYASDSDQTELNKNLIGYQDRVSIAGKNTLLAAQFGRLSITTRNETERLNTLILSSETDFKGNHLSLRLEPIKQLGAKTNWQPVLASSTFSLSNFDRLYIELFSSRDLIDSVTGIRDRLLSTTLGASADYQINTTLTVVGSLYQQNINDDNQRNGTVLRLIYSSPEHRWFNIQTRSKIIKSTFNGQGYFSPLRLEEHWLLTTFIHTTRDDKWVIKYLLGLGQQSIDQNTKNDTLLLELKLRGWQTDHFGIEFLAGYTNNDSFSTAIPSNRYHYRYVNVKLIGSW